MIDLISDFLHLGQITTDAIESVNVETFRFDPADDLVDERGHAALFFLAKAYQIRAENAFFNFKREIKSD